MSLPTSKENSSVYWLNIVANIAKVFTTTQWLPVSISTLAKVPSIGCALVDKTHFYKKFFVQVTPLYNSGTCLNFFNISTASVFVWQALITQNSTQIGVQSPLLQLAVFEGLLIVWLLALTVHLDKMTSFEQQQAKGIKQELERKIDQHQQAQETLMESQARLKLINSMSLGMMLGMSVEQIIKRSVKQVSEYFNTLRVSYSNINYQGNLTVVHSVELQGMPQLQKSVMDLTAVPEYLSALRMNEPLIIEDVAQDARSASLADTIEAFGIQALLSVPLQHPNELVGLLCLESPQPRKWSEHEIATLIEIAQYLSILIKDAHVHQERQQTELALQQVNEEQWRSQKMLQLVMDLIPQSIWWKDRDSRFLGCNRNFAQMTGVGTPENIVSKTDYDVWTKEEADFFRSIDERIMAQNQAEYCIVESVRQPDGTLTWLETNKIPLHDEEERVIGTLGTAQDITERKQAEEQIKASLQEKEVLLEEVHHRVKNNLQVIDSLFRHQRRNTKDEQTNEILKECQNRVNSMALLHEKLYQSTDLSKIAFAEYIRSLVANLVDSYTISSSNPTLKINISNIFLDIEKALPCGLIVNELVTNSLKHAFTLHNLGEICIEFNSTDTQNYVLVIKDNGIGLPEDFEFSKLQTLGLKLVRSLVRQLAGIIEIKRSKGTEFQIIFPGVKDNVKN